jgi:arylsulfatase A-like enzyme
LRGYKGQVWEGGIRVPYLVQWKAKLPAGKVYDHPVTSLDIVPTAVAAAGGTLESETALDGVDLVPYLTGQKSGRPHDALFWRFGPQWAIRKGDLKLLGSQQGTVELFDLAADVGEARDLSAEKPEIRKELEAAYAAWNSQLAEPRWNARRAAAGKAKAKGKGKAKGKAKAKATES